jgi:hypothetical protein
VKQPQRQIIKHDLTHTEEVIEEEDEEMNVLETTPVIIKHHPQSRDSQPKETKNS